MDILLAPHPEMYKMAEKRAKIADGAPNPFVNPGEFNAYAATLEKAFDEALAKQTAAARTRRVEPARRGLTKIYPPSAPCVFTYSA